MDIKLIGEKIILKPMNKIDAPRLHELSKDPDLNKYSGPYNAAISIERSQDYIKKCKINIENKKAYCLGIYLKKTKELIGTIGFVDIDEKNSKGEIGFWMGRDYWNKGYMTEAVELMTDFCLKVLKFHRIYAFFHELNKGVEKILEKVGYKREGELKEALKTNERYYNDLIYGITNSTTNQNPLFGSSPS
jgi:[ribosomal protein S5]-alanine N-acetyltransferase